MVRMRIMAPFGNYLAKDCCETLKREEGCQVLTWTWMDRLESSSNECLGVSVEGTRKEKGHARRRPMFKAVKEEDTE